MLHGNETLERLRGALRVDRLVNTAKSLIEIPSPTRSAGEAANRLAAILDGAGFRVDRPEAGWKDAPAVAAWLETDRPGRTLQLSGHLDTVHLPFVPPRVENGRLHGSGTSDMKGGIAAMCEALRILDETGALPCGKILLTAYDLHEAPWGDGSQVDGLIEAGYVGDGVLLPEYLSHLLPVMGRGLAILEVRIHRDGVPVHEVLGGIEAPSVILAGAELVRRLHEEDRRLADRPAHPFDVRESFFVGQTHAGEIYNQSPTELHLAGTRRWLPGTSPGDVEREYRDILEEVSRQGGVHVDGRFQFVRDAFEIDPGHAFVSTFQSAHRMVTGRTLPAGPKPFIDDGNAFVSQGGIPAITHGPDAKGAHTVNEEVAISELERIALIYALTAVLFCGETED